MQNEEVKIEFDGAEIRDLYPDLLSLEVEITPDIAGMARLRIALVPKHDGAWLWLDDSRFTVWTELRIRAGFNAVDNEIFEGYIIRAIPQFAPDPTRSVLELLAFDRSILMDREDVVKSWPNKKDSDIAKEICDKYGFSTESDDTRIVHDEAISTILQRESDARFLKYLARRNGFEFYIAGRKAYFGRPRFDSRPQPVLAAHFEEQTTLVSFRVDVDALSPTDVAGVHFDRLNKEIAHAQGDANGQRLLGKRTIDSYQPTAIGAARVVTDRITTTGLPELNEILKQLYNHGRWAVTAEGLVDANAYGHILKARSPVTIKGVGREHSGIYYILAVTHRFDRSGYTQSFVAARNALEPNGQEVFRA